VIHRQSSQCPRRHPRRRPRPPGYAAPRQEAQSGPGATKFDADSHAPWRSRNSITRIYRRCHSHTTPPAANRRWCDERLHDGSALRPATVSSRRVVGLTYGPRGALAGGATANPVLPGASLFISGLSKCRSTAVPSRLSGFREPPVSRSYHPH
jgi:hypothetical protein